MEREQEMEGTGDDNVEMDPREVEFRECGYFRQIIGNY